jgi:hypothetical protein
LKSLTGILIINCSATDGTDVRIQSVESSSAEKVVIAFATSVDGSKNTYGGHNRWLGGTITAAKRTNLSGGNFHDQNDHTEGNAKTGRTFMTNSTSRY